MSEQFSELLIASEPHPDYAEDLDLFGRFVGEWAMEVRFFDPDGATVFDGVGTWTFSWILDGRAVQDVLMYDLPDRFPAAPGVRRIGSSVRSFHPDDGTWRVTWVGASGGIYLSLKAQPADYGISIVGVDQDGSPLHWSFAEITDDSFQWTGRTMSGRDDWWVEQKMTGHRKS